MQRKHLIARIVFGWPGHSTPLYLNTWHKRDYVIDIAINAHQYVFPSPPPIHISLFVMILLWNKSDKVIESARIIIVWDKNADFLMFKVYREMPGKDN